MESGNSAAYPNWLPVERRNTVANDRIGGIVRAMVGVSQERLVVLQQVVNNLNVASPHGDQFQTDLSKFVLGWEPVVPAPELTPTPTPTVSDLDRWMGVYEKLFSKKSELSGVRIPKKPEGVGPVRLIVVARELLEWTGNHPLQGVQDALKKHFLCWQSERNLDKEITENDRDLKNGSYAVWVRDVREADEEFANKSADDLKVENHIGITALERQLLEADYFFERGEHLDQQNITLCSGSRRRRGRVSLALWRDREFYVYWCDASDRHPSRRSRRVWA